MKNAKDLNFHSEIAKYRVHPEVVKGDRNHLFISGGNHRVEEYLLGKTRISEISFQNFENNLKSRENLAQYFGAKYIHIICPDKSTVCRDAYPFVFENSLGELYQNKILSKFLYPVMELKTANCDSTYYRTDSHWSIEGTFIASEVLLQAFEHDRTSFKNRLQLSKKKKFTGDLGVKLDPKDSEEIKYFPEIHEKIWLSNDFTKNNGLIRICVNLTAKNESRLLIFGDSFLNLCMSPLSDEFRHTIFVRTPYFHPELVASYKPTHIITGNAERYLASIRPDSEAENCFLQAFSRGLRFDHQNPIYPILSSLTSSSPKGLEKAMIEKTLNIARNRNFSTAQEIIETWHSTHPPTESTEILASTLYLLKEEPDLALPHALRSVSEFGRTNVALCHAGAVLLKINDSNKALELFDEAVKKNHLDFQALRGRARSLARMCRFSEAMESVEAALVCSNRSNDAIKLLQDVQAAERKALNN